jgi:hypothetical protein
MKPINVELTMGHNIGVSASYYKPQEHEVLEDYLTTTDQSLSNESILCHLMLCYHHARSEKCETINTMTLVSGEPIIRYSH